MAAINTFQRTRAPSPALRRRYLASLPEAQEWFLEDRVQHGDVWEIPGTAYAVFDEDTLVELYVTDGEDPNAHLSDLKRLRPFDAALCKSFDHLFVAAARGLGAELNEVAYLFRQHESVDLTTPNGFGLTPATSQDVDAALTIGGDFFASRAEVETLLCSGGLWIARHTSDIIGCGTTIDLNGPHSATDIGMVVSADHRTQGFGAAIVAALATAVKKQGRTPICGCAKSNFASKATLEKAGFITEHALLHINFPPQ